jgi:hypothetical protein
LNEPDRIVGELLQPGGYLKLIELGLEGTTKRKLNYVYMTHYFFNFYILADLERWSTHDYFSSFLTPLTTIWRMIMACLLLQIVWRKLMLSKCLGMLFSRMGNTHDSLIPWKSFTQILLAEAFTMGVLFRG